MGVEFCEKLFQASIEMIILFLVFSLLMWCITLIDLHMLENPCTPGINPTWSWFMILLKCWIWFASLLLRIFASIFISDIGLFSFFVWYHCLVLGSRWWSLTVNVKLKLAFFFLYLYHANITWELLSLEKK